jgi:hypothetical protein
MKKIDWDLLEPHYRAGIRSLQSIGEEFGCSDTAIIKHAKKERWTRDLFARIKAKAEGKVCAAAVGDSVGAGKAANEKAIVEANAEMQKDIILSHRADIREGREILGKLMAELNSMCNPDVLKEFESALEGHFLDPDEDGNISAASRKRLEAALHAVGIGNRASVMQKLADSLGKLITLERQAFGIGKENTERADPWREMLAIVAQRDEPLVREGALH